MCSNVEVGLGTYFDRVNLVHFVVELFLVMDFAGLFVSCDDEEGTNNSTHCHVHTPYTSFSPDLTHQKYILCH